MQLNKIVRGNRSWAFRNGVLGMFQDISVLEWGKVGFH